MTRPVATVSKPVTSVTPCSVCHKDLTPVVESSFAVDYKILIQPDGSMAYAHPACGLDFFKTIDQSNRRAANEVCAVCGLERRWHGYMPLVEGGPTECYGQDWVTNAIHVFEKSDDVAREPVSAEREQQRGAA